MAYIRVQDREEEVDVKPAPFSLNLDTSVAQSTPSFIRPEAVQRFPLGEGLPSEVKTEPFATRQAVEQKRQAEISGQRPTTTLEPTAPAPLGRTVTGGYTPVGLRIKLPFAQKGITIPDDFVGEITKDLIQTPEKIFKSIQYQRATPEQREEMKIKDETKIFQSPLYQKDYKEMVDRGVSPIGAFALTGISAAVDASVFADLIAKPLLKLASKTVVSRAMVESLTRKDIIQIMRGEEFAGKIAKEKTAAFIKAREIYGDDLVKILKQKGNKLEVKMAEGKTLGQWMKEQKLQPGLSIRDTSRDNLMETLKEVSLSRNVLPTDKKKIVKWIGMIERGTAKQADLLEADSWIKQNVKKQVEKVEDIAVEKSKDLTKTPAFKSWFKDSKVVDESGTPEVLYHGSADEIRAFDKRFSGETTANNEAEAFYFTNDKATAESYSREAFLRRNEGRRPYKDSDTGEQFGEVGLIDEAEAQVKTTPAYVKMENPLIIDTELANSLEIYRDNGFIDTEKSQGVVSFAKGVESEIGSEISLSLLEDNPIEFYKTFTDFDESMIDDYKDEIIEYIKNDVGLDDVTEVEIKQYAPEYLDQAGILEKKEFDGVIFKDVIDNIETGLENIQDVHVVFEPNQIKSINNKGGFDPLNEDILFGAAGGIQEEDGELKFSPTGALLGLGASKIVKTGTSKKIPSSVYKANRAVKKSLKTTITRDTKAILAGIKLGTDKYLGSLSTRLKNIDPSFKRELRNFEFKARDNTLKDTKKVKPFLESSKKMEKVDRVDFDLARKNGDVDKINELVTKYGIEKEYDKTREVLDNLYDRAEEVGYDIGYLENYSPRMIKDKQGFIDHFRDGKDWNTIDQAIKAKENALQRQMTEDEKVQLINTMIRGYAQNNISLSEIGNMKAREIDIVDAELNQYYMGSDASLVSYIKQSNDAIAARKFFGKGEVAEGVRIDDSIGNYTLKQLESGKITPQQEALLSEMLKARFNETGTRGVVSTYKNLSYIDTMGSVTSAITQLGDLSWALYKAGVPKTVTSFARALTGKSKIKKEDIGIDNIAAEFDEPTKAAKAVNKVFKATGLEKMDALGKETLINSVITKYQTWARKGNKRLQPELEKVFGKDTEEIIADLKSGEITENVKLLAFNELADVQPILLSEMPQKYLTGGNSRIFYMLKTFTLKQFDIYRNEIFQQIANKGTRIQGLKNLVSLIGFFTIMNATADEIKDFILNRKTSLKDRTVDNLLRAFGFSKYLIWKTRTEGFGSAAFRQIAPPFKFIDSVSKDIRQGIENGSEVVQSIPIVGKLYYWWFGKGQYKNEKRNKKKTRLDEFETRIEKAQGASRLKDFEDRINKIQSQ